MKRTEKSTAFAFCFLVTILGMIRLESIPSFLSLWE